VVCEQASTWEQRAVLCPRLVDTPLGANSARLVPPGAAATPDNAGGMLAGAISPAVVARAAIEAVEADEVVVRQRVDGLLADLV
jgi:hypothetical protein